MTEATKDTMRRKKGWMDLRIREIRTENKTTKTVVFEDAEGPGRPFDFIPGQYLTFRFEGLDAKPIVRSYTLSNAPSFSDSVDVTVKEIEGGVVSNWLSKEAKVGGIIKALGPIGRFCCPLPSPTKSLGMIAGGSGVTPFISIIREYHQSLGDGQKPQKLELLVAYRNDEELIMWDELKKLRGPNVHIEATLSRQNKDGFLQGRINPDLIDHFFKNQFEDRTYMMCGPVEMMEQTEKHLVLRGVDPKLILKEAF